MHIFDAWSVELDLVKNVRLIQTGEYVLKLTRLFHFILIYFKARISSENKESFCTYLPSGWLQVATSRCCV